MATTSFGLDIGIATMKLVSLSTVHGGIHVNAVMSANTPPKGMLSESSLDQEEMARAIKKLIEEAKVTSKSVNIALPENQVYTRVIEMPILSDKELASAIYWEAEQYIPVPLNTVTLDYTVLYRPEKAEIGGKMQVLLAGAPTNLINKYEKILTMAGVSIRSVETEILSAVRVLLSGDPVPVSLVMNIGSLSTSLAIVSHEKIMFTYVIPTGGTALSRAIASDFGFSLQQADEYKKTYGLNEQSFGGRIGQATAPILQSLVNEIKKTIVYYKDKYKDDVIQQVIVSGGTAHLPGLATHMASALGIEVVVANPWKMVVGQELPKPIIDDASEYTVAVGLAMRDYE